MKLNIYKETVYEDVEIPFELPSYWRVSCGDIDGFYRLEFLNDKYYQTEIIHNENNYSWQIRKNETELNDYLQTKINNFCAYSEVRENEFQNAFDFAVKFIVGFMPKEEEV